MEIGQRNKEMPMIHNLIKEAREDLERAVKELSPVQKCTLAELYRLRLRWREDRWHVPRPNFSVTTLRALNRRGMFEVYKEKRQRVIFSFSPRGDRLARLLKALHDGLL
jgi:hypothetical protein